MQQACVVIIKFSGPLGDVISWRHAPYTIETIQ